MLVFKVLSYLLQGFILKRCVMVFNSAQKKGVVILLLLIGILVLPGQFLPKEHDFFLLVDMDEVEIDTFLIQSDPVLTKKIKPKTKAPKRKIVKVELNGADSAMLDAVRGIGPYYAKKILSYRELLGGYYSVEQLKEIKMTYFNTDSAAYYFFVDSGLIRQRDLDTMSFKSVLRHPYLEYENVKAIFNAKRKFGRLSYALLEEKQVLPPLILKKIKPYFK